MLFKRGSATAREARLAPAAEAEALFEIKTAGTRPAEPSRPSAEELEIARLREANAALEGELKRLRDGWQAALEEAEARAREAAARQHVSDDAQRLAQLRGALDSARQAFDAALAANADGLAPLLAREALGQLVEPKADEAEWLARAVARRVGQLRDETVIALHLPAEFPEGLLNELRQHLPGGAAVVRDPERRPGTARIALRLGRIEIDPATGLRGLLAVLEGAGDGA